MADARRIDDLGIHAAELHDACENIAFHPSLERDHQYFGIFPLHMDRRTVHHDFYGHDRLSFHCFFSRLFRTSKMGYGLSEGSLSFRA
jgi:hypothetical protein